ncbi:MAG TPA: hypothetical protein VNP92_10515 [Actinophytocola sp.]|nr:hypothetical protein [Actinophytocola sp.]
MSLVNVWIRTQSDGLVRADQIVGIDAHQTPALSGKPARWLLDVVLPASVGSGHREGWSLNALHRTLIQTSTDPGDAPTALARLLAQLDLTSAAGVISTSQERAGQAPAATPAAESDVPMSGTDRIRFRFIPFASPAPGHHTGQEYL